MEIIEYSDDLKAKYLGSGYNGSCYLTKENQVFKSFNNPSLYTNNISSLVGIYSSTYIFPKVLVSLDSIIIGYIKDYVDGVELQYINKEISLEEYIIALKIAEYDIAAISYYRILSFDVDSSNILFSTDNKFKIIDTDFYRRLKSRKGLYASNLGDFSTSILYPILNVYDTGFHDKKLLKETGQLIDGKLLPSKYIKLLLKYMNIKSPEISIADFSRKLKSL